MNVPMLGKQLALVEGIPVTRQTTRVTRKVFDEMAAQETDLHLLVGHTKPTITTALESEHSTVPQGSSGKDSLRGKFRSRVEMDVSYLLILSLSTGITV